MSLPRALVNLLNRPAIEGSWDAQQAEINEAILKATGYDHEKTRILIRMPTVRAHVDKEFKDRPKLMQAINIKYGERIKKLGAELEGLNNAGPEAEERIAEKQREIEACKAEQKEVLQAGQKYFYKKLGVYLTRTLENKRVYEARGWRDEVDHGIAMSQKGEDVELEGRGQGVIRGTTVRGAHASAVIESKSNPPGTSRIS